MKGHLEQSQGLLNTELEKCFLALRVVEAGTVHLNTAASQSVDPLPLDQTTRTRMMIDFQYVLIVALIPPVYM